MARQGAARDVEDEEDEDRLIPVCEFPWGLHVSQDWLNNWISVTSPKSPCEKKGKDKDDGKGKRPESGNGEGTSGKKRKEDHVGDGQEEPIPSKRKNPPEARPTYTRFQARGFGISAKRPQQKAYQAKPTSLEQI